MIKYQKYKMDITLKLIPASANIDAKDKERKVILTNMSTNKPERRY